PDGHLRAALERVLRELSDPGGVTGAVLGPGSRALFPVPAGVRRGADRRRPQALTCFGPPLSQPSLLGGIGVPVGTLPRPTAGHERPCDNRRSNRGSPEGGSMAPVTRPRTQVAIMNAVHDLPVLVARDKGFFRDEGLDLEFVTTPGMAQVTTTHTVRFDSVFERPLDSVYNEGGI